MFFLLLSWVEKKMPFTKGRAKKPGCSNCTCSPQPQEQGKVGWWQREGYGSEDKKEGGQLESKGDKLDQDPEEYLSGPSCCGVDNGQCAQCSCPFLLSDLLLREQRKKETIAQLRSRLHACIQQCAWHAEWQRKVFMNLE